MPMLKYLLSTILLLVFAIGTWQVNDNKQISAPTTELASLPTLAIGDWVVRMGTVADSQWISYLSQSDYSHIGLIVQTKPIPIVIHATTDDGEATKGQVMLTPLKQFLSTKMAKKGLIIRPLFLTTTQKQQIANIARQQLGRSFVLASKDQPHLYCTTLLQTVIQQVYSSFKPHWQYLSVPLFEGEYLFPQAFVDYPNTKVIYQLSNDHG